jgi:hypothetical protein
MGVFLEPLLAGETPYRDSPTAPDLHYLNSHHYPFIQ